MRLLAGHLSWHAAPAPAWVAHILSDATPHPPVPLLQTPHATIGSVTYAGIHHLRAPQIYVAADARIDDVQALWHTLRTSTDPAMPPSPAHLIARAYTRWGADLGRHVLGDYAIALWDARQHRLVLIRDAIGICPLFYTHTPGGVAVASTVRALLAHPQVSPRVNEEAVTRYLVRATTGGLDTFFEGIRAVPPAHALVLTPTGTTSHRYWQAEAQAPAPPSSDFSSDVACARGLRTVLQRAVNDRMAGSGTGVSASGGLDSAAVACLAHIARPGAAPLPLFAATFPNLPPHLRRRSDERAYLNHLTRTGRFRTHQLPVDHLNPAAHLDDAVRELAAPPHICNLYLQRHIHRSARQAGCTVLLDGSEGDVAVSHGFGWLSELAAARRWTAFIDEVQALVDRIGGARGPDLFWAFGAPYLRDHIAAHKTSGLQAAWLLHRALGVSRKALWMRCVLGGDSPATAAALVRPERAALLPERPEPPLPQTEREAHAQSLYVDDAATGAVLAEINHLAATDGIERRHPFYDRRVLEYCLALPPTQKLRHGWTRWVLRTAMAPDMPAAIRWRAGKSNLAPTFERNLLRDAAPRLDAAATHPQLTNYLAPGAVAAARASGDATTCWRILGVAAWFDAWPHLAASSMASSSPLRQDVSPLVDAAYPSSLPATVS